ncbi:hypothetical protein D1Z98_09375, partial [Riemerella anatipestifer]|nr:hypothetical protein [Riemerella anatipestifer]
FVSGINKGYYLLIIEHKKSPKRGVFAVFVGFCRCILYNPKIIHFNCIFQGFKNSIKTQLFSIKCIFRLVCFLGAFFAKTPLFSGFFGLFYSILI